MVVNVFLLQQWFSTISLNGAKSRPTILLESRTKSFYHKSIDTFCFIALTTSVAQNIRGVTGRHCLSKRILSQQRYIHKLLQSIYFAYEIDIISSYSNRICYRKIPKSRTTDAWELHAALRTVFENHCSTSNITPASYDVTVLAITPEKHQRLTDLLLQSGVVTHDNRV